MLRQGIKIDDTFDVIVSISAFAELNYNPTTNEHFKVYDTFVKYLPLGVIMQSRSGDHNLNTRSIIHKQNLDSSNAICCDYKHFGKVGNIVAIDDQKNEASIKT